MFVLMTAVLIVIHLMLLECHQEHQANPVQLQDHQTFRLQLLRLLLALFQKKHQFLLFIFLHRKHRFLHSSTVSDWRLKIKINDLKQWVFKLVMNQLWPSIASFQYSFLFLQLKVYTFQKYWSWVTALQLKNMSM